MCQVQQMSQKQPFVLTEQLKLCPKTLAVRGVHTVDVNYATCPTCYGTLIFSTVLKRYCHLSVCWARWICSKTLHIWRFILILCFHLCLVLRVIILYLILLLTVWQSNCWRLARQFYRIVMLKSCRNGCHIVCRVSCGGEWDRQTDRCITVHCVSLFISSEAVTKTSGHFTYQKLGVWCDVGTAPGNTDGCSRTGPCHGLGG
jgi:hypothetical protein